MTIFSYRNVNYCFCVVEYSVVKDEIEYFLFLFPILQTLQSCLKTIIIIDRYFCDYTLSILKKTVIILLSNLNLRLYLRLFTFEFEDIQGVRNTCVNLNRFS